MAIYAQIKDNKVVKTRETSDELLIIKLLAHDYKIVEELTQSFDSKYQNRSSNDINYDIQATKVVSSYTITDKPVDEVKTQKLSDINSEVNQYINSYYDTGTQQSFTAIYTQQDTPTSVKDYLDPVLAWIQSVMAYYYTKKAAINACTTISQLKAVTWTFDTFTETKPNVSLGALMTSE